MQTLPPGKKTETVRCIGPHLRDCKFVLCLPFSLLHNKLDVALLHVVLCGVNKVSGQVMIVK